MRRQISPGRSGWLESEIDEYLPESPGRALERTNRGGVARRASRRSSKLVSAPAPAVSPMTGQDSPKERR